MRAETTTAVLTGLIALLSATFVIPSPAQAEHYQASHCEVFVDKVSPSNGSHALRRLTFYIKTINERLDAPIEEVGFWAIERRDGTGVISPWRAVKAQPFWDAQDYWQVSFTTSGDYIGYVVNRAALYVRTTAGTTYWLKRESGRDFRIDYDLFQQVESITGRYNYRPRPEVAANTRDHGALRAFNPQNCH